MSKYLLPVYKHLKVDFVYGKGSVLNDKNSKKYIDFTSGIGVNCLGHAHPKIIKTIRKQAEQFIHISNVFSIKTQKQCAQKIVNLSGYKNMQCFFCNSGAEANEAAIKFIRKYAYVKKIKNHKIITLKNSFHGRTLTTLNATGQKNKQVGFEPFPDEFIYAEDINDIKNKINKSTAAVMIELIQGEGGINSWNKQELLTLEKYLKQQGILFVIDEVQTGVFRTGEFLASNYYEIQPNIITIAKGLGGGLPIGIMMSNKKNIFTIGDHGSTFGGNPLCTKTANKVLSILEKRYKTKKLNKTINIFEKEIFKCFENNKDIFSSKVGIGLMQGLQLIEDKNLDLLIKICLKNGVLVLKSGKNIIRFLPPLNISKKVICKGFQKVQKALDEFKTEKGE